MDTSKEYIEMCGKATEIQKNIKVELGTFYFSKQSNEEYNNYVYSMFDRWDEEYNDDAVWLPRQDQLQEMLNGIGMSKKAKFRYHNMIHILYTRYLSNKSSVEIMDYWRQFKSMEQLWLAFVMIEKYNKIWITNKLGHGDWYNQKSFSLLADIGKNAAKCGEILRKTLMEEITDANDSTRL